MKYIVSSKDRACQLDLHIRCMLERSQLDGVYILYDYSTPFYKEGYRKLQQNHYLKVLWISEVRFKYDLVRIVEKQCGDYVLMMADDQYFIDSFDDALLPLMFEDPNVHSVSIRLMDQMTISGPSREYMGKPHFICRTDGLLVWDWQKIVAHFDWGYPMATTGTIFRKDDILPFLKKFYYTNIGWLENQLNHNRMQDKPLMASFNKSCTVELPFNCVITEIDNPCKGMSLMALNKKFLEGWIIDTKTAYDVDTKDSFMSYEANIRFIRY